MRTQDFQNVWIYRIPEPSKRTAKDGTPRDPKRLGRIHFPVFTADGARVVGFMVTPPDVAGMVKRADRFVARDAIKVYEGAVAVEDVKGTYDAAAAERLGIDLDTCIIWTGMDVVTRSGKRLGYCSDAAFNPKTGAVTSFTVTGGMATQALLGTIEMPASMLRGYREGAMIVSDAAAELELSGGAAARAGEISAHVGVKVKKGAQVLDDKGSEALDKGSRALGKQLGRTRGMFSAFKTEFKRASGGGASRKR